MTFVYVGVQLADLLHIIDDAGMPSESNRFIFNGDFVDRGAFGVEVRLAGFRFGFGSVPFPFPFPFPFPCPFPFRFVSFLVLSCVLSFIEFSLVPVAALRLGGRCVTAPTHKTKQRERDMLHDAKRWCVVLLPVPRDGHVSRVRIIGCASTTERVV